MCQGCKVRNLPEKPLSWQLNIIILESFNDEVIISYIYIHINIGKCSNWYCDIDFKCITQPQQCMNEYMDKAKYQTCLHTVQTKAAINDYLIVVGLFFLLMDYSFPSSLIVVCTAVTVNQSLAVKSFVLQQHSNKIYKDNHACKKWESKTWNSAEDKI